MTEPFSKRAAELLDEADPLPSRHDEFHIPRRPDGSPTTYLAGHSLGLQPKTVRALMEQELDQWAALGVEGHFREPASWYTYHELFRDTGARLVGARPGEVVMMNSLTVNLHLLLATFYRPTVARHKILIEEPTFPSDRYAVLSQMRHHGYDPAEALLTIAPRPGGQCIHEEDVEELLERRGSEIALVLMGAVNFFTGQLFDLARLTTAARRQGCVVGFDLAHAAGNVVLHLHDWQVDFAVWCSYKYLNAGPGAVAGCFVHETHGRNLALPRLAGWWGNDPATRFRMHLEREFVPRPGADGWQISNPPIFALVPLRASLAQFDAIGMPALRGRSERLTAYAAEMLGRWPAGRCELITPREPARRGSQLSLLVHDRPRERFAALQQAGVVCDFREPNVIRFAAVPLYNTFKDVRRFGQILATNL